MKNLFNILLAAAAFALVANNTAIARDDGGKGFRDSLIGSGSVEKVYPVDDHHTFIKGAIETDDGVIALNMDGGVEALLVEHTEKEPFVYKSPVIPPFNELKMPANGEFRFSTVGGTAGTGDFAAYGAADLFEHMTALCRKENGTPVYVIPKSHGSVKRMTEVKAVEAFRHIISSGTSGAWELACEGGTKFLLSKDYNFTDGPGAGARFFAGRGLEGVNYVKDGDKAMKAFTTPAHQDTEASLGFIEEIAYEVSTLKMSFVKVLNGERYEGLYHKTNLEGCDIVSVKNSLDGMKKKVHDYKVCSERIVALGERVEEEAGEASNAAYPSKSASISAELVALKF